MKTKGKAEGDCFILNSFDPNLLKKVKEIHPILLLRMAAMHYEIYEI